MNENPSPTTIALAAKVSGTEQSIARAKVGIRAPPFQSLTLSFNSRETATHQLPMAATKCLI